MYGNNYEGSNVHKPTYIENWVSFKMNPLKLDFSKIYLGNGLNCDSNEHHNLKGILFS